MIVSLKPKSLGPFFVILIWALVVPFPASSFADHSVYYDSVYTAPPNFYFDGNWSQSDDSVLTMYVTVSGDRYRVRSRAGSGNGSTDECATSAGWLPAGAYGRNDGDSNSRMEQMYKTWGDTVVRGQVWFLDKKNCGYSPYTQRTELFIHSNGIEGTSWDYNWKTAGCIKVSQHARTGFYDWWAAAYDRDNERLNVRY